MASEFGVPLVLTAGFRAHYKILGQNMAISNVFLGKAQPTVKLPCLSLMNRIQESDLGTLRIETAVP